MLLRKSYIYIYIPVHAVVDRVHELRCPQVRAGRQAGSKIVDRGTILFFMGTWIWMQDYHRIDVNSNLVTNACLLAYTYQNKKEDDNEIASR